jgi:hypothetical protein
MIIKKITKQGWEDLYKRVKNDYVGNKDSYHSHTVLIDFVPITIDSEKVKSGEFNFSNDLFDSRGQLLLESDGFGKYDFENAVKLYNAFDGKLTALGANDARLWVRLTHDHGHKYLVKRWMGGKEKKFDSVKERFFYEGKSQAARLRNGLARLWWIAHLTVNNDGETEEEKWKYTEAVCKSQDFITSIFERSMGAYENVRFGILEYYLENENAFGGSMGRKIQHLTRELNNYGGVTLLPLMSKDEIKELCSRILPVEDEVEIEENS